MEIPLVDLKAQYQAIKADIDAAVQRVLNSAHFIMGEEVARFEQTFAGYMGAAHVIGVANGTDALQLALVALGIGPGDEVITTPHTFIATVEPILHLGAKPVFVDIDPVTYTIDPALIEAAITEKTKAIIPVHLYGQLANMPAIHAIAERYHLPIIEDAAQSHGAEYGGQRAGSWGKMACFSFYPGKNLGAYGDAGAIITNDDVLAEKLKLLRDHGSPNKYEHVIAGYNSRLDAMQAAILTVKLAYVEAWTEQRRQHARCYDQALADIPGITRPQADARSRHVYHLYVIRTDGHRDALFSHLRAQGIGVGIHYPMPLHLQPALAAWGFQRGDFPCAEAASSSIISLPMYPELTQEQVDYVVQALSASAEMKEMWYGNCGRRKAGD